MHTLKVSLIALALALGAQFMTSIAGNVVLAETLVVEDTDQFYSDDKPTKGMSKDQVHAEFGEPLRLVAPVGDPPITRWEYDQYTVFFEYDHVIHAVNIYRDNTSY